jgi:indolepyruvate ferredoxin oxidoreductase
MASLAKRRSAAIVSSAAVTAAFVRDRDDAVPIEAIVGQLQQAVGADALRMIDAQGMAMALLGDTIGGNLLLLGFAYQHGLIPVSVAAIEEAIRLNNVAVDFNLKALAWGGMRRSTGRQSTPPWGRVEARPRCGSNCRNRWTS